MKKFLYPHQYVQSIYEVDYNKLSRKGIKGIIFDIDNTLVPYYIKKPTTEIVELIDNLKKQGFRVAVVSNNTKRRALHFTKDLKVNTFYRAQKPRRVNIRAALNRMNLRPTQVAIIGDQIFTDILAGNRTGIYTILVKPVSQRDEPITKIKRGVENLIIQAYLNDRKK
ncbi:MAG: hypothetical protein BEN19_02690 [Epulopiscium sp. Nuni2H_MBin003]|nr:MAG: hypothetical protein BEN19_02690 [Epulopiscium sp. Nuni2H_MBin003]